MLIPESNAVWVDENNTVQWTMTQKTFQNLVGVAKITIEEKEKDNFIEIALPPGYYGSFYYGFETGKKYMISLLCNEKTYAFSTM